MGNRFRLVTVAAFGLMAMTVATPALAAETGKLDPRFGSAGKVLTDFGDEDAAYDMALQPDGKAVVVGYARGKSYDFALARYNADGSVDDTFGKAGKVVTDISGAGLADVAYAVTLQSDGRIVVAGHSDTRGNSDFALARYNADGSLDASFGTGGILHTDLTGTGHFDAAYAVAVDPNGNIVAAGPADNAGSSDFAVARYRSDGSLDPAFGKGGTVLTDLGGGDHPESVAIGLDGAVVVAGNSDVKGGSDFAVVRYRSDGSLDPAFGKGGTVLTDIRGARTYDEARAVTVQPDGSTVVVGSSNAAGNRDFALVRYGVDGSLDSTFGTKGTVLTDITGAGRFDVALAVTVTGDNEIVVAGSAGSQRNTDAAVARYHANGILDATFASGGTGTANLTGVKAADAAFGVAVRPDNRIVVAGSAGQKNKADFAVAQFLG